MRITNKIMQRNSITNLNRNKVLSDKLNNQLTLEKKITRPSDDPVIAIRSLRLNSSITQLTQYYEKNAPDASAWLQATEEAVNITSTVITDMYEQCTNGSKGSMTAADRKIVLESLKSLRAEVYSTGNTDYAGRYLFSGYRTDTPLTFENATEKKYSITEQLSIENITNFTHVDSADLVRLTEANAENGITAVENDIASYEVHRIQLAYSNLDDGTAPTIEYYESGALTTVTPVIQSANTPTPNAYTNPDPDTAYFIPETGEIVLGQNLYEKMMGTLDNLSTEDINEGEIRISYEKTNWNKNDLIPEHYYACESEGVKYNQNFLTNGTNDEDAQVISYDVGLNQSLRVNTTANEVYVAEIGRNVDDLIRVADEAVKMEGVVATLEAMVKQDPENETLKDRLNAAQKAMTYLADRMQKSFEHGITQMQNHLDRVNQALTQIGARGQRLDLISNRLGSQQTTFKTLSSENEDVDIAEVAVQLSSAQLSYEASLMATGKIAQTTLLNYL